MSYGNPSDEVAEDYRLALESLTMNSKYEISNLTVIAKENTEHALAISEALKTHIKQTSPQKKLPAFYVLDSVVKNVGTPYTLFFGRQLYTTFMEAYALVDNNTRKKMDEMLKTWKEPVPGSMDSRPVFPPEVTRPIENALIKAKTSFVQAHQEHMRRGRPGMPAGYRETPTPPNAYRPPPNAASGYPQNYPAQQQYPPAAINGQQYANQPYPLNGQQYPIQQNVPPINGQQQYAHQPNTPLQGQLYPGQQFPAQQNGNQPYGLPPRPPSQQYPQSGINTGSAWQPQPQGYGSVDDSVETLSSDIDKLITTQKTEWAQNPYDSTIGTRLKALLDLQTILQNQKLPPDQIALIKTQVAQLSEASQLASKVQSPPAPVIPQASVAGPQKVAPQPTLSSLLGPGALELLLKARQSATPQLPPQTQSNAPVQSPVPSHVQPVYTKSPPPASSTPVADPSSLLERLRAAGMLPGFQSVTSTSTPPLPRFPPPFTPPTARTPLADIPNDVVLTAASLKTPRPYLMSKLYERLGIPCTQCGRRFQTDEEGKKKKTAHMDWHFLVHQRMAEAETRGQHRSWYVDEEDWISSREVEDASGNPISETAPGSGITTSTSKNSKQQYIPAPLGMAANSLCPVCQEQFETIWLDEAQEFVWMDAKKVGERVYHASCYAEATKDVNTVIKRGTPEPVLGKRKAEDEYMSLRAKIKSDPTAP